MATSKFSQYTTAQLGNKVNSGKFTESEVAEMNAIIARRESKKAPATVIAPKAEKAPKTEKVSKAPKAEKTPKSEKTIAPKVAKVKAEKPAKVNVTSASLGLADGMKVTFNPARNAKNRSNGVQTGTIAKVYPTDDQGNDWLRIVDDSTGKKIFKLANAIVSVVAEK